MIDNNLVSSKAIIAKVISDLDLKEDEIKITDIRQWIGEAMEKIGAIQQLEHKVVNLKVKNYQAKLPCDLYRLDQVAFSFTEGEHGWLPMRKTTNSFGVFEEKNKKDCNNSMLIQQVKLLPLVRDLYGITDDKEALDKLNDNPNIRKTLSTLVNQYTIPTNNGRLPINSLSHSISLQYSQKPGYINTNVPNGYIKVSYYTIITDEDSMPMIPDMASYHEAIFWYVAMKLMYPKYLKGQMPQYIYHDMRSSWAFYRNQAYAEAMMPGNADEMESIKNAWHTLYPEFHEHDSFFEYTGDRQKLYNTNWQ